jgi:hypothetical protein
MCVLGGAGDMTHTMYTCKSSLEIILGQGKANCQGRVKLGTNKSRLGSEISGFSRDTINFYTGIVASHGACILLSLPI